MVPETPGVSVLVPLYNEVGCIEQTLRDIHHHLGQAGIPHQIIVIDDASTDGSGDLAKPLCDLLLRHGRNRGYGGALKTGIAAASHELILTTDADGTYPIDQMPAVYQALQHADMVVGARIGAELNHPLVRRPAKWVLRMMAMYVTGDYIPDFNSGLRGFRRSRVTPYLPITPDGFSISTTITMAFHVHRLRMVYLPINYYKRIGDSKIVPYDFVVFFKLILRLALLFKPLRLFLPPAAVLLGLAAWLSLPALGGAPCLPGVAAALAGLGLLATGVAAAWVNRARARRFLRQSGEG